MQPACNRIGRPNSAPFPIPRTCAPTCSGSRARPHHVGSPYDKDNAEWIAGQGQEWGLDAQIETFDVLFPTPKERAARNDRADALHGEDRRAGGTGDATSDQQNEQLPVYNAYSIDGDVTAPLVYVNYGIPADYEELDRLGISVKGAIVIARYGGSLARHQAQGRGGARRGGLPDLFRPARRRLLAGRRLSRRARCAPRDGAQRGSVMDMPVYPGDPLTPGSAPPRTPSGSRSRTLRRSPRSRCMPISYGDAQPLLAALKGRWRRPHGAARCRSRITSVPGRQGPSEADVQLGPEDALQRDRAHSRAARFPTSGSSAAIITTPGSTAPTIRCPALAPLMEEMRALGTLLKQGWKPKRTIIYCAWDGEEPGLLGSTEWAEAHADGTAAQRRRSTSIPMATAAASCSGGLAHAGEVHQRRGARHRRSRS